MYSSAEGLLNQAKTQQWASDVDGSIGGMEWLAVVSTGNSWSSQVDLEEAYEDDWTVWCPRELCNSTQLNSTKTWVVKVVITFFASKKQVKQAKQINLSQFKGGKSLWRRLKAQANVDTFLPEWWAICGAGRWLIGVQVVSIVAAWGSDCQRLMPRFLIYVLDITGSRWIVGSY